MFETSEYIDKQAFNDELAKLVPWAIETSADNAYMQGLNDAHCALLDFPAADVAPVRHGTWKQKKDRDFIKCSSCGFQMFPLDAYQKGEWPNMCVTFCDEQKYIPRFCPDCGAKMDA